MYAIDGNNSLKRIRTSDNVQVADSRNLNDSDYFISQDFVDRFANEVKARKGPPVQHNVDDESDDEGVTATEGDPTDGMEEAATMVPGDQAQRDRALRKGLDTCVKNWKSASDDDSKRMWAIFDESGVFMSACRHGLVLWIIDMVRSGELYVL